MEWHGWSFAIFVGTGRLDGNLQPIKNQIFTLSGLALFIALSSFVGGRKWTHPKGFEKSFAFIEGNEVHDNGFFMQRTEVSNLKYRSFLQAL